MFKQLPSLFRPTVKGAAPPDPMPRLSPATIISVVPPSIDGVQENPVPCVDEVVILDSGIANDCPPGMMPPKVGVLKILSLILFTITIFRLILNPCTVDAFHQIRLDSHCVN